MLDGVFLPFLFFAFFRTLLFVSGVRYDMTLYYTIILQYYGL